MFSVKREELKRKANLLEQAIAKRVHKQMEDERLWITPKTMDRIHDIVLEVLIASRDIERCDYMDAGPLPEPVEGARVDPNVEQVVDDDE